MRPGLLDTSGGTLPPPLRLGNRCRALASGPYRDDRRSRWAGTVEYAVKGLDRAVVELRAGLWSPGPDARPAVAGLYPSLVPAPGTPELPIELCGETAWIQRVVRLAHLGSVLEALWVRRETSVALWERAYMSVALREHIVVLEQTFPSCVACPPP